MKHSGLSMELSMELLLLDDVAKVVIIVPMNITGQNLYN